MRSKEKFEIELIPKPDGLWVSITFKNGFKWIPSFEDLIRILRAIGRLEDEAYPYPAKGRWFMIELLRAAFKDMEKSWEELADEFQIPIRE